MACVSRHDFLICTAPAIAAEPAPLAELRYDQPAQNVLMYPSSRSSFFPEAVSL